MAKTTRDDAAGSLRQIITDIRNGNSAPVYILHGEESYYIDLITENLEKYAIAPEDRDFNCDIFYGPDADVDYVIGAAKQFPVMAPRKLVILKEAQGLNGGRGSLDKFAPYVAKPSTGTVFVIAFKAEALKATSEIIKAAKKGNAVIFQSDVPADWEFHKVVLAHCTSNRINIEERALNMMEEFIGAPLSKFYGELDKLVAIKGAGNRITVEDVERHIGVSKDFNNFELVNAIAFKNYPKAIQIIKYFEAAPKETKRNSHVMVTAQTLYNFFANLVAAHYLPNKSEESLRNELGLRSRMQIQAMQAALRNYSAMKAVNAIHYIREFDTKSKGVDSNLKPGALLGELLFKLFT